MTTDRATVHEVRMRLIADDARDFNRSELTERMARAMAPCLGHNAYDKLDERTKNAIRHAACAGRIAYQEHLGMDRETP